MKSSIEAMQELRRILPTANPLQLAIALEAVAFVQVETYMELNPPPDMTEAQRAEAQAAMIFHAITKALNTAADVALELSAKPAQQPDPDAEAVAKAQAESVIAKMKGDLH